MINGVCRPNVLDSTVSTFQCRGYMSGLQPPSTVELWFFTKVRWHFQTDWPLNLWFSSFC